MSLNKGHDLVDYTVLQLQCDSHLEALTCGYVVTLVEVYILHQSKSMILKLTIRLTGRAIHGTYVALYEHRCKCIYISVREYSFELAVKIETSYLIDRPLGTFLIYDKILYSYIASIIV